MSFEPPEHDELGIGEKVSLVHCPHCNRTFFPERLEKHVQVCEEAKKVGYVPRRKGSKWGNEISDLTEYKIQEVVDEVPQEETQPCPYCTRSFFTSRLEKHVNVCSLKPDDGHDHPKLQSSISHSNSRMRFRKLKTNEGPHLPTQEEDGVQITCSKCLQAFPVTEINEHIDGCTVSVIMPQHIDPSPSPANRFRKLISSPQLLNGDSPESIRRASAKGRGDVHPQISDFPGPPEPSSPTREAPSSEKIRYRRLIPPPALEADDRARSASPSIRHKSLSRDDVGGSQIPSFLPRLRSMIEDNGPQLIENDAVASVTEKIRLRKMMAQQQMTDALEGSVTLQLSPSRASRSQSPSASPGRAAYLTLSPEEFARAASPARNNLWANEMMQKIENMEVGLHF
jgi:hypothetical protein